MKRLAGRTGWSGLQDRSEIKARRVQGRKQSKKDCGEQRHAQGETEHARVRLQIEVDARRSGRGAGNHAQQKRVGPMRQQQPCGGARTCEEQALRQQLPDQAPAPRADGNAHGEFSLPRRAASEQEVRYVSTSDEKHESHHGHQNLQRLAKMLAQHGRTARRSLQIDALIKIFTALLRRDRGANLGFQQALECNIDAGLGLFRRNPGLQPGHNLKPHVHVRKVLRRGEEIASRINGVLHHHGNPKIGERSDSLSKEFRGSDAYNLE